MTTDLKTRISDATTRLVEADYVEAALSIDISIKERSPGALPRLADEVEALALLAETNTNHLEPWTSLPEPSE